MIRGVYQVPLMMLRELGCQPLCGRGRTFVGGHAACAGVCGVSCEAVEEGVEVVSGVGPVEWFRGCVVAVLKADDAFGELVAVGEVVGVHGFSLQYREVDLHLVEPGKLRHGETSSAVRT